MEPEEKFTTDLEYREAAVRLAIEFYASKRMDRVQSWEVIQMAQKFEEYLRGE